MAKLDESGSGVVIISQSAVLLRQRRRSQQSATIREGVQILPKHQQSTLLLHKTLCCGALFK